MYREEKWIDGILHMRGTPTAKFKPMSVEALNNRIIEREKEILSLESDLEFLRNGLDKTLEELGIPY